MAHYALLDNNLVINVIVGVDENEGGEDWEQVYGERLGMVCKRTSYNTSHGVHRNGGTPFRKNYAGIGFTYDEERDAFIPPKPLGSFVLNEETCDWEPPYPMPDLEEGQNGYYRWNEEAYHEDNANGWEYVDLTE